MKVLVGAFNQEKGLLRDCKNFADGSFAALIMCPQHRTQEVGGLSVHAAAAAVPPAAAAGLHGVVRHVHAALPSGRLPGDNPIIQTN